MDVESLTMDKKFKKDEPLTLRDGPRGALKIEVFSTGLRVIYYFHVGSPQVVACVVDDEHARELLRWLRAQSLGRKPARVKHDQTDKKNPELTQEQREDRRLRGRQRLKEIPAHQR